MDEQNPRLGERVSGRGEEETAGRENPSRSRTEVPQARTEQRLTPSAAAGAASAVEPRADGRTREIREEIESTREEMSETVNAIQDRLRPSTIASQAADSVKEAAKEKARDVAESDSVMYVRSNPIPTAMVGIGIAGLAWLALGGNEARPRSGGYGQRDRSFGAGRYAYGAGRDRDWRTGLNNDERRDLEEGRARYGSTARYAVDDEPTERGFATSQGGSDRETWADRRFQTSQYARQARRTWEQSPLLIGAASAVLGAIIGFAVPETERENQLMGEARDSMVETVQGTVREKVDQVQQAATDAVSNVQNAAKSVVGLASPEAGGGRSEPRTS